MEVKVKEIFNKKDEEPKVVYHSHKFIRYFPKT